MELAADFVERFQHFWRDPARVSLATLLAPDVHLVQPLSRGVYGVPAAEAWNKRLLTHVPSLRGTVERWSAARHHVFIEFRLHSEPYGIAWPAVDRFLLGTDALAKQRVSYFDGLALLLKVARRPRSWLPMLSWALAELRAGA